MAVKHERSHSNAEPAVEAERAERVVPEKPEEQDREIEKESVKVLEHEGKRGLAAIGAPRLSDRAGRRVQKERAVVRLPVVVAGGPETEGPPEDQKRRRERPPAVLLVDERRVERREVGAPLEVAALQGAGRRVKAEEAQDDDDRENLQPPGVAAERRPEAASSRNIC